MTIAPIHSVVLIGTGNVATQLALALHENGLHVAQIWSNKESAAKLLAAKVNAGFSTNIGNIISDADLYIIAIRDQYLKDLLATGPFRKSQFIVHTSGSLSLDVFKGVTDHYGVFYPLQTFSKNRKVDFQNVPLCIEANSKSRERILLEMGHKLSSSVQRINSQQRRILHLGAVFACNFPNFMYTIAEYLLARSDLSFDLLKPLILETAAKVQEHSPGSAQTGPAVRNDRQIIREHLDMLADDEHLKDIYESITGNIIQLFKPEQ